MIAQEDFESLTQTQIELLNLQGEKHQYDEDFTPEERCLWDDGSLPQGVTMKLVRFRQAIENNPADALEKEASDLESATEDFDQLKVYLDSLRGYALEQIKDIENRTNDEGESQKDEAEEHYDPEAEFNLSCYTDQPEIVHEDDYLPHRDHLPRRNHIPRRRRNHASNHNTGARGNYNRRNADSQYGWGAGSAAPLDNWGEAPQSGQGAAQQDGWGGSAQQNGWYGPVQSGEPKSWW
jgi:hypothetical protein